MKKFILIIWLIVFIPIEAFATIDPLNLKVNDTSPYYTGQIINLSDGTPYDLTGATITVTMSLATPFYLPYSLPKISSSACVVTNSLLGIFEYRWIAANTNAIGKYTVLFTITKSGVSFTVPATDKAYVCINAR
jgi:hypothetical protein